MKRDNLARRYELSFIKSRLFDEPSLRNSRNFSSPLEIRVIKIDRETEYETNKKHEKKTEENERRVPPSVVEFR